MVSVSPCSPSQFFLRGFLSLTDKLYLPVRIGPALPSTFHNNGSAKRECSSKAKMSALSKVEMSVSAPFWEFGGCYFDGHGGDEQARAEPSGCSGTARQRQINGSNYSRMKLTLKPEGLA